MSRYIGDVCPSWVSPKADTNIAPSREITRQVGSITWTEATREGSDADEAAIPRDL